MTIELNRVQAQMLGYEDVRTMSNGKKGFGSTQLLQQITKACKMLNKCADHYIDVTSLA